MLGTINPQTIKIDQQAVVYPGRDHVTVLTVKRYDGRSYRPVDTSLLTRVVLVFPDTSPTIAYDSNTLPAVFSWTGSTITIDLSDYAMPASSLPCYLVAFDAEHPSGQVLVDNEDTTLEFDFRNINTTGLVPAPAVEFITDAPIDGKTYGRKDGAWVTLAGVIAGVVSVNGQTGVVTLGAADVGADPTGTATAAVAAHVAAPDPHPQYVTQTEGDARYERVLVAGANITIDRTNPNAPIINSSGGGGGGSIVVKDEGVATVNPATALNFVGGGVSVSNAGGGEAVVTVPAAPVQSVNGKTGVVVLSAADVGADPTGTSSGAIATHVAAPDPHPQYTTTAEAAAAAPVQSVNGKTGAVVLNAADVGAEPAGAVAAHVALADPHTQYAFDTDVVNARFQSTGLISGGALSINGVDNTKFNVAAGVAVFADYTNPSVSTATTLAFGPLTAITVPNLASANASYIGINSAGTIVQQTTRFTNTQRRSICSLGAVIHSNNINLNAVNTIVSANRQLLNQFGDGIRAIGQLNLSGNVYSPVGATLQIQRSAGELFSPGANFHNNPDDPHAVILGAVNPATIRYRLANGTEYADRTTIDPANYDNSGVLTAVPANKFTVQLIALFQSGITRVQYGQVIYNTISEAVSAAQSQSMTVEQNIAENGVIRAYLAVKSGATALNNTADAVFANLSKFSATTSAAPLSLSTTDELTEGVSNLYFTVARVRNTLLTGLSTATNAVITAADTVLDAFGKLQAQITSHFGVGGSTHPAATTSVAGFQSAADKTKLDGIATGATANQSDAFLLARANHTGTQASGTISDFTEATQDIIGASVVAGTNVTVSYNDGTGLTTIAATGGGATLPVVQALNSTRNLALADINTFNVNSTTNNYTVTIPPQASVAWTADAELHFLPTSAGDIVITGGAGVSVNGVVGGSVTLSTAFGAASMKRVAADSWWVGGVLGTDLTASSINGGQLAGLRNKIINGNPLVNQRVVSGTVVLAAGEYGHDRWKAGASGCTYTFATSNNITTLTISAGSLQQVVEGNNLQSGTYTLSWSGTAQGKIGAGSYSASGVTGSITGGTNTTVEFNTGTLSLVQLEFGSVATAFEHRSFGEELSRCNRYYWKSFNYATAPAQNTGASGSALKTTVQNTSAGAFVLITLPVVMRAAPTIKTYNTSALNANWRDITNGADVTRFLDPGSNEYKFGISYGSGATLGAVLAIHATAEAEL